MAILDKSRRTPEIAESKATRPSLVTIPRAIIKTIKDDNELIIGRGIIITIEAAKTPRPSKGFDNFEFVTHSNLGFIISSTQVKSLVMALKKPPSGLKGNFLLFIKFGKLNSSLFKIKLKERKIQAIAKGVLIPGGVKGKAIGKAKSAIMKAADLCPKCEVKSEMYKTPSAVSFFRID
jgi:hypothetical protein